MKRCSDIDALVTPFVDGDITSAERAAVVDHLGVCPPCRRHEAAERIARDVVRARADGLLTPAPWALRSRCRTSAPRPASRRLLARWPLAMAATFLLALAGAVAYGTFVNPSVAAAAQLTLDHLKCFTLFDQPDGLEPADVHETLRAHYGWDIDVPDRAQADGLSLVGGRRCVYLDGAVAHLLYKKGRVPVSVFVLPQGASLPERQVEIMGYSAVAFERGGRTWVVLARQPRDEVATMAAHMAERAR